MIGQPVIVKNVVELIGEIDDSFEQWFLYNGMMMFVEFDWDLDLVRLYFYQCEEERLGYWTVQNNVIATFSCSVGYEYFEASLEDLTATLEWNGYEVDDVLWIDELPTEIPSPIYFFEI